MLRSWAWLAISILGLDDRPSSDDAMGSRE
jgi:hypothetical protein